MTDSSEQFMQSPSGPLVVYHESKMECFATIALKIKTGIIVTYVELSHIEHSRIYFAVNM